MFRQLTLLVAAGVVGPILASGKRSLIPGVIGELAAGALIGKTGFQLIDPHASAFPVFYSLGFAMLMMTAGTHVDLRSPAIRSGARKGALAFAVVLIAAVPFGFGIVTALGIGHPLLLIVLLSGSSAAVAFPMIDEHRLKGPTVAHLIAWIAIADSLTVLLMPSGLTGSGKVVPSLLGDALIVAVGLAILWLALRVENEADQRIMGSLDKSRAKGWALQLRLSILVLLALASIAEGTGGSLLVAGFVAGMILVRIGEPDRLALQISGIANGFFVPLFFVLLGAELDLRALVSDPKAMALAVAMAVGAVVVHLLASLITGSSRRVATGLAASAQLGLPAAAASLAIANHSLSPATAAALVAAGCLTLAPATVGVALLTTKR